MLRALVACSPTAPLTPHHFFSTSFCARFPKMSPTYKLPCESAAMALIGLGVVMLMQPFSLALFGYSFVTILAGTLAFVIVSHFPD